MFTFVFDHTYSRNALMTACLTIFLSLASWTQPARVCAQTAGVEDEARRIAAELRCPVCQNLSVADSPSEMAQQMRELIREQLAQGESPQQIKAYFVSKYGDWVLLAPPARGFGLVIWVLPFAALAVGLILAFIMIRRWARQRPAEPSTADPRWIERVRREMNDEEASGADPQASPQRRALLAEKTSLYRDLREIEFDYKAGKLSEDDYLDLRSRYENRAAAVLRGLDAEAPATKAAEAEPKKPTAPAPRRAARYGPWSLAGAGSLLLLLGLGLGFLLSQSLRPRESSDALLTGDFLTGTGPGGIAKSSGRDLSDLLKSGRAAFERQEWSQAIDAFKKVLEIDPDEPTAHAYMGMILTQAGHIDGALMAFNRALVRDGSFGLALWGKGMLLLRAKEDYAGARESLGRLVALLPPGPERDEVQRALDEIPGRQKAPPVKPEQAAQRIQGTVKIAPELKAEPAPRSVLFIIVRSADSAGGPPLAVKKIPQPSFPLPYSIGPEDVMLPGKSLAGKVAVAARLDDDGDPMTRGAGDLAGEHSKNPIPVGSKAVDVVIGRAK